MPVVVVVAAALGALTCLAAVLSLGALVAATLLPSAPATTALRLAAAAAAAWSAAGLATVVSTAPRDGAALSDPAGGVAVLGWALGGGAPLSLSALGAAAAATVVLVRSGGRSGTTSGGASSTAVPGARALALAVLAAAPLGTLPSVLSASLPGALSSAAPAGLLVLPGSRQAAVVVAGWLALVGAGAWLGGAVVALLSRRAGRSTAPGGGAVRRGRALARWSAPVVLVLGALALAGALVPPAAPRAADAGQAGVLALTGALPPPLPLTAARALLQVAPDPLWLVLALGGAVAYLRAVRGLGWPRRRTAAWCAGCLVAAWATSGGPAAYAPVLLSAQMVVHAVLVVLAAPLLVAGAPLLLLERAAPSREDGTPGVREVVGAVLSSRSVTALRHPALALAVLLAVLAALWATPLLAVVQSTVAGHEAATAAVLGTALLAAGSAASAPRRAAAAAVPAGLAVAVAAAGAWLATTDRLLAAGWSTRLGLGVDALADQRAGGVLATATVLVGCLAGTLLLLLPVAARARAAPGRSAQT